MNDRFASVQHAANTRGAAAVNSEALARQIVSAAEGDMRVAYEFLDTLNAHVTRLLRNR